MRCEKCGNEMVITYEYKAKDYYESDETEYKCLCCETTCFVFQGSEEWDISEDDGYLESVGMQVSDLIERR